MKHYYHPMSRAVSTYWMLLELGVEFEQVPVDFMAGENLQREFTSINPMAKIPTLVDGGVVVTEAAAICAYLADKFPEEKLAPPLDSTIRGAYYRYMIYPAATGTHVYVSANGSERLFAAVCGMGRWNAV